MTQAKEQAARLQVGDFVLRQTIADAAQHAPPSVLARVVEDRGDLGTGGRQIVVVEDVEGDAATAGYAEESLANIAREVARSQRHELPAEELMRVAHVPSQIEITLQGLPAPRHETLSDAHAALPWGARTVELPVDLAGTLRVRFDFDAAAARTWPSDLIAQLVMNLYACAARAKLRIE